MRKIIFIEPKSPNLHIFSKFPLPRLGIFILGAILKEKGWDVEIIVEQSQKLDFEKMKCVDMVGISTITPTAPRAFAIADRLRCSGVPVIMGGPHVTFLPDEALGEKQRKHSSALSKHGRMEKIFPKCPIFHIKLMEKSSTIL